MIGIETEIGMLTAIGIETETEETGTRKGTANVTGIATETGIEIARGETAHAMVPLSYLVVAFWVLTTPQDVVVGLTIGNLMTGATG